MTGPLARDWIIAAFAEKSWYDVGDRQDWKEAIADVLAPMLADARRAGEEARRACMCGVTDPRYLRSDEIRHVVGCAVGDALAAMDNER